MHVSCVQSGSEPPPIPAPVRPPHVAHSRRWRQQPVWALASAVMLGVAGCGAGTTESDISYPWPAETSLRILTWWETDDARVCKEDESGEVCAGQALTRGYVENTGGAGAALIRLPGKELTLGAIEWSTTPGEGAIVNGGADIQRLANCGSRLNPSKLASLGTWEDPVDEFVLRRTPPELLRSVSCDDHRIFGMVLGLHRLNQLFYNKTVTDTPELAGALLAQGIELGKPLKLEDFRILLETVATVLPNHDRPLFIHNDSGTWSRFVIENIMVALANEVEHEPVGRAPEYASFWGGLAAKDVGKPVDVDTTLFENALAFAAQVARYVQTDNAEDNSMAYITYDKTAVFAVTGDWEVPRKSSDVEHVAFPGTERSYVYTPDVAVAIRQDAAALTDADPIVGWLKAITSESIQNEFSIEKHSVSPVHMTSGVSHAKTGVELFTVDGQRLTGIPGLPAYVPHATFDKLETQVQDYMLCVTHWSYTVASAGSTIPARCEDLRSALVRYVKQQYCTVVSDNVKECIGDGTAKDEQ